MKFWNLEIYSYLRFTIMLMATHTRKLPPKCRLFLIMGVPTLELFYLVI